MKHESHRRQRSAPVPVRSVTSSTVEQKQVGQTIVQLPQDRQREATSSQRGCSKLSWSSSLIPSVRSSTKARYRQWMTHKLGTWIDQFGSSGCVGCGRCVTWGPVGIDLTEEVAAIRAGDLREGLDADG